MINYELSVSRGHYCFNKHETACLV